MAAALAGVEKPWSALAWAFIFFLAQTGVETAPLPLYKLHFWHCRQFSVRRSVQWSDRPVSTLMSGCSQGHKPQENY